MITKLPKSGKPTLLEMMEESIESHNRLKLMRSITPGLQYLSNINVNEKPIVLQAIELSQRFDILWFDHPIPDSKCNPNDYGCVAAKITNNGFCEDTSSFWEAYRNIESLVK